MTLKRWTTSARVWEKLKPAARVMRHDSTAAEKRLWEKLRDGRLQGMKFRRQHTLGRYIVDFYCPSEKLAIEVDGGIHRQTRERDAVREDTLNLMGCRVIRFENEEIMINLDAVIRKIESTLKSRSEK